MHHLRLFLTVLVLSLATASAAVAQATYEPDQSVEVEVDGVWLPATVIQHQNQFIQIRLADGVERWVPSAQLRLPGTGDAAPAPAAQTTPAAPASPATPAQEQHVAPQRPAFRVGQKAECKWGARWDEVVIKNRRATGWLLVQYTGSGKWMEWVEPWRLREVGSTEDALGFVQRHGVVHDPARDQPPSPRPGPAPVTDLPAAGAMPIAPGPAAAEAEPEVPWPSQPTQITEDPGAVVEIDFLSDPAYQRANYAEARPLFPADRSSLAHRLPVADFEPDPAAALALAPGETLALDLKHGGTTFNFPAVTVELTRQDRPRLLVELRPFNNDKLRRRMERVDVADRASVDMTPIPLGTRLVAASPDGLRFAVSQEGNAERDRIEIWDWPIGAPATRTLVFYPYRKSAEPTRHLIRRAWFLDRDTLATLADEGGASPHELVIWDLPTARAKWTITQNHLGDPILSPGGRQLALKDQADVLVFDLAHGTRLAKLEKVSDTSSHVSFTGAGDRLVITTSDAYTSVYDLCTGERVSRVSSNRLGFPASPFVDQYILEDRNHGLFMIDPHLAAEVWCYDDDMLADFRVEPGGYAVYATSKARAYLVKLPHPAALEAAKAIDPATALAVGPGIAVSLELRLEADDAQRQAVETALRQAIAESGLVLKPDQPLRLVASTKRGEPKRQEFRPEIIVSSTGATALGESGFAMVTPHICILTLELDGKALWEQRKFGTISGIRNRPGQNLQEVVDAAGAFPFDLFTTAELPERIAAVPQDVPESTLTEAGLTD